MSHWSPECNFVPVRAPHEIVNKVSGQRLVDRINIWLTRYALKTGVHMMAKLDPHHNVYEDDMTWSIEIVPVTKFHLDWVKQSTPSHFAFLSAMDGLIAAMRDKFGLVTEVIRRKGRVETHHAIGGMHVQLSADLFRVTTDWYRLMERFHRDLVMDYANRPYARWLLAHWMGEGSRVVVDRHRLEQRDLNGAEPLTRDDIFSRALWEASAIEPRFMRGAKNSYLTFEFRFVGMVQNATQMCAAVRLIDAWVRHHVERTYAKRKPIQFNLTLARWDEMATPEGARRHCRAWVEGLGLDWGHYERDFFERNLLMRIAHGKLD